MGFNCGALAEPHGRCFQPIEVLTLPPSEHPAPPPPGYDEEARYFEKGVSEAKREELVEALEVGRWSCGMEASGHVALRLLVTYCSFWSYIASCCCPNCAEADLLPLQRAILTRLAVPPPAPPLLQALVRPAFESQLALLRELALTVFKQQLVMGGSPRSPGRGAATFVERAQRCVRWEGRG